jgi:HlyD family secretion protein
MNKLEDAMLKSRLLKPIAVLALIGALSAGCSLFNSNTTTSDAPEPLIVSETSVPAANVAEGHLVPARHAELPFANGGVVAAYAVEKGQSVKAGDILVTSKNLDQALSSLSAAQAQLTDAQQKLDWLNDTAGLSKSQADQAVAAAQKALIEAQNKLKEIDTDQYQTNVDNAKEKVNDLKSDLDDAKDAVDDVKDLDPDSQKRKDAEDALDDKQDEYDQAVRDYDLLVNEKDSAQAAVDVAQTNLEDAKLTQSKFSDGPNKDDLALAQANLTQAKDQVTAAQTAVDQAKIMAPFDGMVYQTYPEVGEYSAPASPVVVVASQNDWIVETDDLTELMVVDLEAGDEVKVTFDALPGKSYTGTVTEISQVATSHLGDVTYTVKVSLQNVDALLRWGMTASVYLP